MNPCTWKSANPTPGEIAERLHTYWQPYHDKVAELTRQLARQHGHCILWDAHSILSRGAGALRRAPPRFECGHRRRAQLLAAPLAQRIVAVLSAQSQFSFVVDGRFKGGYITRRYGNPAARIDAVQLEIAQCAYLVEARTPAFDAARALPLKHLLRDLLSRVAAPDHG